MDFPVSNTADNQPYSIDFVNDVQNGETVQSATVTLTLFNGTDPNPNGHLQGPYSLFNGTIVTQGALINENDPTFGQGTLNAYKYAA